MKGKTQKENQKDLFLERWIKMNKEMNKLWRKMNENIMDNKLRVEKITNGNWIKNEEKKFIKKWRYFELKFNEEVKKFNLKEKNNYKEKEKKRHEIEERN